MTESTVQRHRMARGAMRAGSLIGKTAFYGITGLMMMTKAHEVYLQMQGPLERVGGMSKAVLDVHVGMQEAWTAGLYKGALVGGLIVPQDMDAHLQELSARHRARSDAGLTHAEAFDTAHREAMSSALEDGVTVQDLKRCLDAIEAFSPDVAALRKAARDQLSGMKGVLKADALADLSVSFGLLDETARSPDAFGALLLQYAGYGSRQGSIWIHDKEDRADLTGIASIMEETVSRAQKVGAALPEARKRAREEGLRAFVFLERVESRLEDSQETLSSGVTFTASLNDPEP